MQIMTPKAITKLHNTSKIWTNTTSNTLKSLKLLLTEVKMPVVTMALGPMAQGAQTKQILPTLIALAELEQSAVMVPQVPVDRVDRAAKTANLPSYLSLYCAVPT
jgi:hypothetical protein